MRIHALSRMRKMRAKPYSHSRPVSEKLVVIDDLET